MDAELNQPIALLTLRLHRLQPFLFLSNTARFARKMPVNNPEIYHYHVLSSSLEIVKVDTCLKLIYTRPQDTVVLVLVLLSLTDSPNSG